MSELAKLISEFQLNDVSATDTYIDGVRFFKSTKTIPRMPIMYDPGIIVIAQGHKVGYLGERSFRYDSDNYLLVNVTTPFECATFPEDDEPLLGIYIDIDMQMLHGLISQVDKKVKNEDVHTLGSAKIDSDLMDAVIRLVKSLKSETESAILGQSVLKEILYRVLSGSQAHLLYALASHDSSFSNIARVVRTIHSNYQEKLDVDKMASTAGMSTSSFHRAFKEVTSESPMQYLKKVRLNKAREMMLGERTKAYAAADSVGYESVSQFSREFKRYFGQSPAELIRQSKAI